MEHFVLRTPRRSFLPATLLLAALLPVPAAGALQGQASPDASIADSIFAEWDREGSPGCAVGAYQAGETVLARGYGEANLDWGLPITASTVFYSGSVSKQFAAATAALLHLDGTLDLDADIRSYVPELPPYDPPVTVRHLVHHTSGVRDIYGLIALAGGRVPDAWTDEEYLALLARQGELNFDPGQEYLYSNGAYYLLTTAIERSSGQRLDEVARELIFRPLGMDDTHFHQDRERIVPRRAMSYGGNREEGFRQAYLGNFDKAGAGGLYTTIQDLAAWDRNFETGEVGGEDFLKLIHSPGVLNSGDSLTYAFGLQIGEWEGYRTVGHGGSFMGFRADFVRFPDEGLTVAALCNLGGIDPGPLTRRTARAILGGSPAAEEDDRSVAPSDEDVAAPVEPSGAPLRSFAGSYYAPDVGGRILIRWTGSRLRMEAASLDEPTDLEWISGNRFRAGTLRLDFEVDGGIPAAFRLDAGRVKNLLFRRQGDRTGDPDHTPEV
jgi:CubicO group peptidase (beta-lactamase class C family)